MDNKKVFWGIIGCGDVAELKSGPAFSKLKNSALVSVMRRNESKVRDFAERHQIEQWTTDASELLNNAGINAVYIATPPASHLDYALRAIQAGKHVYLEKPMVLNYKEAKVLLDAEKKGNSKITVAHYRRALPIFQKVKALLDTNAIGKIVSAEILISQTNDAKLIAKTDHSWRLNPEISGGGYFHDIAPHQIDLMCYYFGDTESITKGVSKGGAVKELINGEVRFKNGVKFSGTWNFNALENTDKCIITGEHGSLMFSFYNDMLTVIINGNVESYRFENPKHVQQPMIEKTNAYFLGSHPNPCSVEEAAVVTKIMDVFCGTEEVNKVDGD